MNDKAKQYSRIKYTLAIADFIYLLLFLVLLQFSGLAVWLRLGVSRIFANQLLAIFFYCLALFLLYFMLTFPIKFYRSFIVEHRFGLSREKISHWLSDQVKGFFLGFFISIILIQGFFFFLRQYPDNWWWISSLFWVLFSVILAQLFPVLIIPLFFKYRRIDNQDLRRRILNLAGRMGIKILDVYQIDFSKKTTKANAALIGLGKFKRIILTDTLQGKFSPEEIELILAHEFAHLKLRHLIKMLILNSASILFIFYILFGYGGLIFSRFDLNLTDIAGLGIWIFCFVCFQAASSPLFNWISRNMERNADYLALKSSDQPKAFVSMIDKLSKQNLSERKPARWAKILFFDHPPVEERIAFAKKEVGIV
ncbi:MAG: M48 family metallopeptidase [Candidatus Omnitrophota bacterium]